MDSQWPSAEPQPIRRLMPEDHAAADCPTCRFLRIVCPQCLNRHADYSEARACMRVNLEAYDSYARAMQWAPVLPASAPRRNI